MAYINLSIQDALRDHRRNEFFKEVHARSLENGFPIMHTQEAQDVLKQVDDAADSFYTDDEDFEDVSCKEAK